ncbi:MAG: hypothetical protein D6791_15840 [Chloroflexi bacterium]|nr:MAG: hypothetical protein D6791_15840 [Chloroflexota bacterium]
MSDKSTTYFDLQDALTLGGCPICRIVWKAGHSYLDALLYEGVNDPEGRERLSRSLGFCSHHNHRLLSFRGERLGIAILQRAFLQEALRRLRHHSGPPTRSLRRRVQEHLQPLTRLELDNEPVIESQGECPVCRHEAEVEARATLELLKHLGKLDTALREAGGLCWHHLELALNHCYDASTFELLVAVQQVAWETLMGQLDEYIRKSDYRFRHEPLTQSEKIAAERGVAALSGELFAAGESNKPGVRKD